MTNRERIDSAMMDSYNNERADFVRSMNNIMVHMNDEDAYMKWYKLYPMEQHRTILKPLQTVKSCLTAPCICSKA